MTILIFLLVLFVLVLVHEWGHFIVAKKSGMRVDEFGIGFPPKLFGVRRGETEYTFNLFPIGGFVRIFGEDLDAEVEESDYDRAFSAKNKWKQAVVLVAGVAMNVLFAWFLFALALGTGVETAVEENEATDAARLVVAEVLPGSPAAEAGVPSGAIITGVNAGGESIDALTPASFSALTEESGGEELVVTYEQGGETREATIAPEQGLIEGDDRFAVGIALSLIEVQSRPVHVAVYEGLMLTLTGLRDIIVAISGLIWNALQADADLSQVAGPVGIVNLVGEASAFGFTTLLMFTAFISLNLAIINLLPFPALDGGRLLFVGIEALKGSPIRPQVAQALNTVGFALLILLMLAVTWNDIARIM